MDIRPLGMILKTSLLVIRSRARKIKSIKVANLKTAATVRYLPCRGSQAAIMFLASNICWVSLGSQGP